MPDLWTAATLPSELVAILDEQAGKQHSPDGAVRQCLADVLNEYDKMRGGVTLLTRDPYTTPGKPNSTRFICPLGDWFHDESDGMPYFGVAGYEQRLKLTEALIRAHLEQHSLEEWVTEIGRLSGEILGLKSELEGVRDELAFVAKRATEH